jgi:hypothetical protein
MTRKQYEEELAYIATLTDQQVCDTYNVDYRHEALEALEAEFDDEDEDDDDYYYELCEESRFYYMKERRAS